MTTYPASPRSAFLLWCQEHGPVFAANAAGLGLSPAQTAAFTAGVAAAANASLAQEMAQQAALVATRAANQTIDELRTLAGDTVRTIRAFAASPPPPATPSSIYHLAQIPSPADRRPAPPPAKPTNLSATLDTSTGALTLRWKATNPKGTSGTSYIIKRRLPEENAGAEFTFIGVSGTKMFTDTTLTAGSGPVQYTVQGQRAGATGPVSEVFIVSFGRAVGGRMRATVMNEDARSAKVAA